MRYGLLGVRLRLVPVMYGLLGVKYASIPLQPVAQCRLNHLEEGC